MLEKDFSPTVYRITPEDKVISNILSFSLNKFLFYLPTKQSANFFVALSLLKDIDALKIPHGFDPHFNLLHELENLIEWVPTYKDFNKQLRNSDAKEMLTAFIATSKTVIEALEQLDDITTRLGISGRQLFFKKIEALRKKGNIENKISPNTAFELDTLSIKSDDITDLLCYLIEIANSIDSDTPKDSGGPNKKSIKILIVQHLAKIYCKGTNTPKITSYYGGKFQQFLLAINPLITQLCPALNLGSDDSIFKYIAKIIPKKEKALP